MDLLSYAKSLSPRLSDLRRRLHACPETGFSLPQTTALIRGELEEIGLDPVIGESGFITAEIGPGDGETVLLRADVDALPLREEAPEAFAAQNGNMHACGHDLHAASLLGAARILKATEGSMTRRVRFLFQPAEELLEGAAAAVEEGICAGVSAAYMLHVAVNTGLPAGTVILPPEGQIAPSADYFEIALRGKGCHGADPASGVDPLSGAARILLGLQHLTSRELPSGASAVVTVGSVHGGDAYNVIPDSARLQGSLRCYGDRFRLRLQSRIEEISRYTAQAFGLSSEVRFPAGCPSLINDPALRRTALPILQSLLNDRLLVAPQGPSGTAGSEDFAVISRAVPSLMLALAAGDPGVGLHHPKVTFDESSLPYGAATLASLAL